MPESTEASPFPTGGHAEEPRHSPPPRSILDAILGSPWVDADGFRLSLWAGFYTTPVFAQIERSYGLLRDENNILFCLATYGPLPPKGIAEVLGRPKNSISRAVERLLQRGLIRREQIETDRRLTLLTIERSGTALIKKTTGLFRAREAEMLRSLSAVERTALDHILRKLMHDAENWMS
jgi:DNA-binding MarR family transcriptional regulator